MSRQLRGKQSHFRRVPTHQECWLLRIWLLIFSTHASAIPPSPIIPFPKQPIAEPAVPRASTPPVGTRTRHAATDAPRAPHRQVARVVTAPARIRETAPPGRPVTRLQAQQAQEHQPAPEEVIRYLILEFNLISRRQVTNSPEFCRLLLALCTLILLIC